MPALSFVPTWLRPHLTWVGELKALRTRPVTIGQAVLTGLGVYSVLFLLRDMYNYYLLLPVEMRGTLSTQPLIYLMSGILRSFRYLRGLDGTSTRGIRKYVEAHKAKEPLLGKRWLKDEDVPVRRGPRAQILVQGAPHRQVPQLLDPVLEEKFKAKFKEFAASHGLASGQSVIEPNALALWLPHPPLLPSGQPAPHPEFTSVPFTHKASPREFAHIHGGESSMHLFLSPLDAATVIERGWAVRFPFAGGLGEWGRAEGRVLVYAPRDEGEVEVVMGFVRAGWEYLTAVSPEK